VADKQHKNGEAGAPEPDEVTEVTQAATPAAADPSALDEEPTVVIGDAGEETTQVGAGGDDGHDAVTAVSAPTRRPSRLRGLLIGVLIVLSCLAVVVTGLTWWSHYTVMDTEGYMSLVGPIGKDPQAIQRLSEYVGGEVIAVTDLQQRVTEALPERVQLLAGPITAYVEDFIVKGAHRVLSSPRAYELWLEVNRIGHEKIVALLRGDTTNVYVEGSDVRLNLLPLISRVLVWLDDRLPGALSDRMSPPVIESGASPEEGIQEVANWSGRPLPSDFGQITLLQSDALGPAQTAVKWFDRLTWILPLVTAVLIALTIWLSRRRARTAIALGIGAAVAIFITRVIVKRASLYLTEQLREGEGGHIARDVVDAALGPLTTVTIWICVVGVAVAVVVWLLGRKDVREAAVAAGRRVAGRPAQISLPDSPVTAWVVNHVVGVRWGVLVIGLIALALVASSWVGIIVTMVVVLLLEGFLSFAAGQWPFAEPEEDETTAA
jgi:hypothetical protein